MIFRQNVIDRTKAVDDKSSRALDVQFHKEGEFFQTAPAAFLVPFPSCAVFVGPC